MRVKWWVECEFFSVFCCYYPLFLFMFFGFVLLLVGVGVCGGCSSRRERRGEWWVNAGEVSGRGLKLHSESGSNDFVCRFEVENWKGFQG